jgi:hypothetical protein
MKRSHSPVFWTAIAAAVALAIGSIGPWVDVLGISQSGFDKDGVLTLPAAIGAIAGLIHHDRNGTRGGLIAAVVFGVLATLITVIDYFDVSGDESSEVFGTSVDIATVAWGLYLACIGAIVLAATSIALLVRYRPEAQPAPSAGV